MKPVKHTIIAYENVTLDEILRFRDQYGNIIDLTGWTALLQIREDVGGVVILELSTENAGIVIDGDLGKITIHIDDPLVDYAGKYDLKLFPPGSPEDSFYPIKVSTFRVIPTITEVD